MRIVVDLDGVIAEIKRPTQSYAELEPVPGTADGLRRMRAAGHYVIIQTARNMATCESNLGKVMKNVGRITMDWLDRHQIEYDEIYFGKPNAEVYIDDRAIRFEAWSDMTDDRLLREARER